MLANFAAPAFAMENAFYSEKEAGASASIAYKLTPKLNSYRNDKRIEILHEYLSQFNSPLSDYAQNFVETADTYNLDWRLLPAISAVESTFAKRYIRGTHNAWGWGGGEIAFADWPEAIDEIGSKIRANYMNRWGAKTVEEIGPIYAPPSSTWAGKVRFFMSDIDTFEQNRSSLALNLSI